MRRDPERIAKKFLKAEASAVLNQRLDPMCETEVISKDASGALGTQQFFATLRQSYWSIRFRNTILDNPALLPKGQDYDEARLVETAHAIVRLYDLNDVVNYRNPPTSR